MSDQGSDRYRLKTVCTHCGVYDRIGRAIDEDSQHIQSSTVCARCGRSELMSFYEPSFWH